MRDLSGKEFCVGMNPVLIVILRWLHIIPAAIAIGGLIFMRFVLPAAIRSLNQEQGREVFLRARRVFKIMIHASILLLIISGVINSIRFYPAYVQHKPLAIALWHTHMFLAVIVFVISFWSLAGKVPPASHRAAGLVNVILLLVLVAVSSTLQYVRQQPVEAPAANAGSR
ncbi:MAG TPA: hypothetical protein VGP94_12445 [Tepidisphaeraceae bacterium]|jgi:uncharacterized membrane protein|nr:hypothetical protein [Tepidisphaeraceae bacterium]